MKKLTRCVVKFKGISIGLDIHISFTQWQAIDEHGNEAGSGRFPSSLKEFEKWMRQWSGKKVQFAIEASGSVYWIYDLLAEKFGEQAVCPVQPAKMRVIANSQEKNDENDAWWLAYLLHEGRAPKAFLPTGVLRELRIASRELRYCTDRRSDVIRRIRSHLQQLGLKLPKSFLSSIKKRDEARAILKTVQGERGEAVRQLWKEAMQKSREMRAIKSRLDKLGAKLPEVKTIADEMPGLGSLLSATLVAELGDPRRFKSAKAYAKATGLTPGYRISGGKSTGGTTMSRQGSRHARWALTRAVISCLRCKKGDGAALKDWFQIRAKYKVKKKVIVEAAKKLAEGVWRLFNFGEVFELKKAFPVRAA
jgi:transposase